jgi:hypothetical protein
MLGIAVKPQLAFQRTCVSCVAAFDVKPLKVVLSR